MKTHWHSRSFTALVALSVLTGCVTNPSKPEAGAAGGMTTAASTKQGPACERLPTMSNKQKVQTGAAVGAALGLVATGLNKGRKARHFATGALGGALVGALAGSAFKNEIDVEEQPDGTVRLKIPGSLMFASGQHALSPDFQTTLTKVTHTISKYCEVTVRVVGHTDNVGAPGANQLLSENRAKAVLSLMAQQGFERTRIQVEGKGASEPLAPNSEEQGRQLNRRVEIFVRPPAG